MTTTAAPPHEATLLTLRMGDLHPHPAQMRTVYDLPPMAELALQVFANHGVDPWNPIVATPAPDGNGYYVVSGHRRRMATLFSWAVDLWLTQQPDADTRRTTFTLEEMTDFLQTLLSKYTDIESAADALALKFAEHTLAVAPFTGDVKHQVLALQRANYGSETPDALGIAHSFRAALDAGASESEIARNVGQPLAFVQKHLALTRIPEELAELIATGKVPMSVAQLVGDLQPEAARNGMALFVVTNVGQVTAEGLKNCARALVGWHQFATMPMTLAHQGQRNMIRILAALWDREVSARPVQTWASAVMLVYRGINSTAPWEQQPAYAAWIQALGGDTYYTEGTGILWDALVQDLLTAVACPHCPLSRLPERILQQDLSDRPGVLGRPCRTLQRDAYKRCINGFADGDGLDVRVPFAWASHPGVTKQGQFYTVMEAQALEAAWQAQAATEDADVAETEADLANATNPTPVVPSGDIVSEGMAQTSTPPTVIPATSIPVLEQEGSSAPASPVREKADSPIAKMRAQIAAFMHSHTSQTVQHPFATPCMGCQHRLTQSPTKDPNVPHCAWAGRLRTVEFLTLSDPRTSVTIPVCRQYAPTQAWQEIIPAYPHSVTLPRDYLIAQIRLHAKEADRQYVSDRHPFEFLTGRPLGSEGYTNWFETQFTEQVGNLSDTQLFTLFVWSLSEVDRARHRTEFLLPTDPTTTAFLTVAERPT